MDTQKIRPMLISIIVALIVIIIAGSIWWVTRPKVETPVTTPDITTSTPEIVNVPLNIPPASPERLVADSSYPLGLKQLAQSFAERYGSYSSDNRAKNLLDLRPLMTPRLQAIIDQQAIEISNATSTAYEGVSTLAVRSELISNTATDAEVIVQTQRIRTTDESADGNTFYQAINLTFIKSGNEWLVDSVRWQ